MAYRVVRSNQERRDRRSRGDLRSGDKALHSFNPRFGLFTDARQFILAVKRTIFENETKADFESKFLVHIKSATVRMLHAKKLIKEIRPDLTKFHEKVCCSFPPPPPPISRFRSVPSSRSLLAG